MKRKIVFLTFLGLFFTPTIFAQLANFGKPLSFSDKIEMEKENIELPYVNNLELFNFYQEKSKISGEKILQYGTLQEVSINYFEKAKKIVLPNKKNVYQLRIKSTDAISMNVLFEQFYLAEGTFMYVLSADKKTFTGAYTSLNNNKVNKLGTDLIYSDDIIIEVQEPSQNENKSKLHINGVVHGFIHLDHTFEKDLNDAGDCNIDVNCPQGAGWSLQRNAVVMLVNGTGGFCSGSMVNNTSGTEIPYMLTANHCGNDPSNWNFRFRWESPQGQADCGTSAPSVNGPENMVITGGTTRARYSPSDFHLVELNSTPNSSWDVIYAGWNRLDVPATSGAGIHHPSGDIKKISLSTSENMSSTYGGANNDHWKVFWSEGVTEGGSSGSPLFDQNRRIIGQLHGGASGCGSNDQSDFYGKFFTSWEGGGTPDSRLKDWLDPSNMDVSAIDASMVFSLDPYIAGTIIGTDSTSCSGNIEPKFVLSNGGGLNLTSATITYIIDGISNTINWTGDLASFQNDTISLPILNLNSGQHNLQISVSNPNNSIDEILSNNNVSSTFYVVVNGENVAFNLNFDCYADETSWEIINNLNQVVFYGGNYDNNNEQGYSITKNLCLNYGCYKIALYDAYGDGMSYDFCDNVGSYAINLNQDTLVELLESEAAFGDSVVKEFCVANFANLSDLNLENLSVFPNPFLEEINLNFTSNIINIKIIDLTGKLVFEKRNINKTNEVVKTQLNKGIYTIIVDTESKVFLKKLIKS